MPHPALNQLTPAQIERYRGFYVPREGAAWTPFRRHRHAHLLGLLANWEGDMDAVRRHLAAAAVQGLALLETAGGATGEDAIRRLEIPLLAGAACGDAPLRRALAGVPRERWFLPERPSELYLAETFDALRLLAAEQPPAPATLRKLADEAPSRAEAGHPFGWAAPLARGMLAILRRDTGALHSAAAALLDAHVHEARAGKWTRAPEGLVALWPLALEALARRRGLTTGLESPYLPLAVLEVPAPADDSREPDS